MAKTVQKGKKPKARPPVAPASIIVPSVYAIGACAAAGWAVERITHGPPVPSMAVVATTLVAVGWAVGAYLRAEDEAFSGTAALAAMGVVVLAFVALGVHLTPGAPGTEGGADGGKVSLENAVGNTLDALANPPTTQPTSPLGRGAMPAGSAAPEPLRLEEAIDSVRHFVHGYLSGDRDHMRAFAVMELSDDIDKAQLPAPVIGDVSKVPLEAIQILGHELQGPSAMLISVQYEGFKRTFELRRDTGWLVSTLP